MKPSNRCISPVLRTTEKNTQLIGRWLIFATEYLRSDGRSVPGWCNSCQLITFDKNHTGTFKTEGGDLIYSFTWLLNKNGKLLIKPRQALRSGNLIISGEFKIVYFNTQSKHRIDLTDISRNIRYFLN